MIGCLNSQFSGKPDTSILREGQIAMLQVPPGFIFKPSDEVLFLSYLLPMVKGEPLPYPDVVKEIDRYQMRPDEIWNKLEGPSFGNSDRFFITKLTSTNEQSRYVRTVDGGGTWSQEDRKEVYSSDTNGSSIGIKRRFSFKSRESQQRGGWVMHEYRLNCSVQSSSPHSSYVLCRLRMNRANSHKRKAQSELQDSHTEAVNQPITLVPNSKHKQGEIEISGAQSQPQPQLQDYEQSEIEKSEPQSRLQTQIQDNPTNLVLPSNFYQLFLSTTSSTHEQDEIERSRALFQLHQDIFGTEIYGAQSQPQPQLQDYEQSEIERSETQSHLQPQLQDYEKTEIERSEAQSHLQPHLQDYEQSEIEKSEPQSRLQTQVQDNPTNLVLPSNFYQQFLSTTNSAHEQDEIERSGAWLQPQHQNIYDSEIYGAQSQPQPQLQDYEQSEIERSEAQSHLQPQLQDYEQSEIEKSEPQSRLQTQVQDNPTNLVRPSNFCRPFLSTTNSAHEQDEIERSGAWFQSQPQDFFSTEIYGAQSQPQPQPQPDGSCIGIVVDSSSNHHQHANHGF